MKRIFLVVSILLAGFAAMAFLFSVSSSQWKWNINSSGSISSSDLSMLPSRSALLIPHSDDPLTQKVVEELVRYLQTEGLFEKVEVAKFATMISVGGRTPDIFINIRRMEAEGGVFDASVHESYEITLANLPWTSISSYMDTYSPPVISHRHTVRLDGVGVLTGWGLNKQRLIAKEVASQAGKAIQSRITKLRQEYRELPELPEVFYGRFFESEGLHLPGFNAQVLRVSCGLFTHNCTYWLIENASREKLFEAFRTQLKDQDWTIEGEKENLRAVRKNEYWTVHSKKREEHSAEVCDMIVRYENTFTKGEQESAVEELFKANAPTEVLFAFERNMSNPQREELIRRLEHSPSGSPKIYLRLAKAYQVQSRKEDALKMVAAAHAFSATLEDPDSGNEMRRLWKELTGKSSDPALTPAFLRELDFTEVSPLGECSVQRKFGEAGYFFYPLPNDEVAILTARVAQGNRDADREFEAIHARLGPDMGLGKSISKNNGQADGAGNWREDDETTFNSLGVRLVGEQTGDTVWYTADLTRVPHLP